MAPRRVGFASFPGPALAFLSVFVVASSGCDGAFLAEAPVEVCSEVAVQCQLSKGPLGVCERAVCGDGEAGPCFVCTPQH